MNYFETFGFLKLPGLMADCIDEIVAGFDEVWDAKGNPQDGRARIGLHQFIDQSPRLSALIDDPRLDGLVSSLLGEDYNYIASDGNYYVGDTSFHYDSCYPGLKLIKVAFYLDPLTRDTGALRVIPGSHIETDKFTQELWYLRPVENLATKWGITGEEIPAYAIETQPGDVVCFNHKTIHGSFGGGNARRMFTFNYSQRFPEDRLDDLRQFRTHFKGPVYGKELLATAGPERMRHLEQFLEICGEGRELVRDGVGV